MNNDFMKKLDEALSEYQDHPGISTSIRMSMDSLAKSSTINESKLPQDGIYWWMPCNIPDGYGWRVDDYWFQFYTANIVHPEIWDKFVIKQLISIFGLKRDKFNELRRLYNSLPRGRIIKKNSGVYQVHHGGDIPVGCDKNNILKAFQLPPDTAFVVTPHEYMNPDNYKKLCDIIGIDLKL